MGPLEEEATAAVAEARKEIATRQREAKAGRGRQAVLLPRGLSVVAPCRSYKANGTCGQCSLKLPELPGRLKGAVDELNKNKKASSYGDKLIKGKETLADEMGNVDKAEAEARRL